MDKKMCPECGSPKISAKLSERFCKSCGFVMEEALFHGS